MTQLFIKGCIIGFSIAAPVGPIGMLCIRRSLAHGRKVGFISGLGAAAADAAYGCVAAFGLTAISSFLLTEQTWLRLIGGIFLVYLGIKTFLSTPVTEPASSLNPGLGAFLSTFFLTLTNPATILSFIAVFAGLGMSVKGDYRSAFSMVCGVFIGSALWWLILSVGTGYFRSRITPRWMQQVNRVSGLILFGFGLAALGGIRGLL